MKTQLVPSRPRAPGPLPAFAEPPSNSVLPRKISQSVRSFFLQRTNLPDILLFKPLFKLVNHYFFLNHC